MDQFKKDLARFVSEVREEEHSKTTSCAELAGCRKRHQSPPPPVHYPKMDPSQLQYSCREMGRLKQHHRYDPTPDISPPSRSPPKPAGLPTTSTGKRCRGEGEMSPYSRNKGAGLLGAGVVHPPPPLPQYPTSSPIGQGDYPAAGCVSPFTPGGNQERLEFPTHTKHIPSLVPPPSLHHEDREPMTGSTMDREQMRELQRDGQDGSPHRSHRALAYQKSNHGTDLNVRSPRGQSQFSEGDVAQVVILEGPHMGQWVDCVITGMSPEPGRYDIHVLPTDRFDNAAGNSNTLASDISGMHLRRKDQDRTPSPTCSQSRLSYQKKRHAHAIASPVKVDTPRAPAPESCHYPSPSNTFPTAKGSLSRSMSLGARERAASLSPTLPSHPAYRAASPPHRRQTPQPARSGSGYSRRRGGYSEQLYRDEEYNRELLARQLEFHTAFTPPPAHGIAASHSRQPSNRPIPISERPRWRR